MIFSFSFIVIFFSFFVPLLLVAQIYFFKYAWDVHGIKLLNILRNYHGIPTNEGACWSFTQSHGDDILAHPSSEDYSFAWCIVNLTLSCALETLMLLLGPGCSFWREKDPKIRFKASFYPDYLRYCLYHSHLFTFTCVVWYWSGAPVVTG